MAYQSAPETNRSEGKTHVETHETKEEIPIPLFVSYARENYSLIIPLLDDLRTRGYDPWIDQQSLLGGVNWIRELESAINSCVALLVIVTPESVASNFVLKECLYGEYSSKHIIPLMFASTRLPIYLINYQYIDFIRQGYKAALSRLFQTLGYLRIGTALPSTIELRSLPEEDRLLTKSRDAEE